MDKQDQSSWDKFTAGLKARAFAIGIGVGLIATPALADTNSRSAPSDKAGVTKVEKNAPVSWLMAAARASGSIPSETAPAATRIAAKPPVATAPATDVSAQRRVKRDLPSVSGRISHKAASGTTYTSLYGERYHVGANGTVKTKFGTAKAYDGYLVVGKTPTPAEQFNGSNYAPIQGCVAARSPFRNIMGSVVKLFGGTIPYVGSAPIRAAEITGSCGGWKEYSQHPAVVAADVIGLGLHIGAKVGGDAYLKSQSTEATRVAKATAQDAFRATHSASYAITVGNRAGQNVVDKAQNLVTGVKIGVSAGNQAIHHVARKIDRKMQKPTKGAYRPSMGGSSKRVMAPRYDAT